MSATPASLIDPDILKDALQHLGLTAERFWSMSGAEFHQVLNERYITPLEAYCGRARERADRTKNAYTKIEGAPYGQPLHESVVQGTLDPGAFVSAMRTLLQLQAEDEADPSPESPAVLALVEAMGRMGMTR